MKQYSGFYYEVKYKTNSGGLADKFDTYEAAVQRMNDAFGVEKEKGYKKSSFIIVKTEWNRIFDDDGTFYSEQFTSKRVE